MNWKENMNTGQGGHLCDGPWGGIGDIVTVAVINGKPVSGVEYYLYMTERALALESKQNHELLTTSKKE